MSSMFCDNKLEAGRLEELAKKRVPKILHEFSQFFPNHGKVGITVTKKFSGVCWSVGADLTFDGELVKSYPDFDLLELDLLHAEMGLIARSRKKVRK